MLLRMGAEGVFGLEKLGQRLTGPVMLILVGGLALYLTGASFQRSSVLRGLRVFRFLRSCAVRVACLEADGEEHEAERDGNRSRAESTDPPASPTKIVPEQLANEASKIRREQHVGRWGTVAHQ